MTRKTKNVITLTKAKPAPARATRKTNPVKALENAKANLQLKLVERATRLMEGASESWLGPYVSILDRYRDGETGTYPLTQPGDRRYGSNFPFWISEQQLGLIRADARVIVNMNPAAFGLLNGLTSYVIGEGFSYTAKPKTGDLIDPVYVDEANKVIGEFIENNAWAEMEQELFFRSREDGEAFVRLFPDNEDGKLIIRTVEPEQILQPPGSDFREWSYGIQTDPDDVFDIKSYNVHYYAPGGKSEEPDGTSAPITEDPVPAENMVHIKANVKRSIKRGLSDFSYDTGDIFTQSGKLRKNLGEGAAVQAAIAAVRQHETSTLGQVDTMINAAVDFTRGSAASNRQQNFQVLESGSFLDIPKGMSYVPPPGAANGTVHLSIHSALLRLAGQRHNAPEWLCSGDASNNNYASSLTAESPFLKNCKRLQKFMARPFSRIMRAAIACAANAGRLPSDILDHIEIAVTFPTLETRDKLQEAQANQVYVTMGAKSVETVCNQIGENWETELQNNEDYKERFGQQLPPLPGVDEGDGFTPNENEDPSKPTGKPKPQWKGREGKRLTEAEKKTKHDAKGRFTAGGGSSGGKKTKVKPTPAKSGKPGKGKPAVKSTKTAPATKSGGKSKLKKNARGKRPGLFARMAHHIGAKLGAGAKIAGAKIAAGAKKAGSALAKSKLGREIRQGIGDVKKDFRRGKVAVKGTLKKFSGR